MTQRQFEGSASRAVAPTQSGFTQRDGVRLAYDVYGGGDTTVLLMPAWSIVHSRIWKAQIGYLARHFRVVTYDGRGNGRSDRPAGAPAYAEGEYAADTIAVMDATDTRDAVLVALSSGATWAVQVAADHPERVLGIFAMSSFLAFDIDYPHQGDFVRPWNEPVVETESHETEGWAKYNKHYWLEGGYEDFLDFFFREMYVEPHSTKQIEDGIGWGMETTPETLVDTTAGRLGLDGAVCTPPEEACARVHCPVTVVHGTRDRIRPRQIGERLAELTGGSFVLLEGVGHGPMGRHPVQLNLMIREFAERIRPPVQRHTWVAPSHRRRRALYLSSPIGLGHAKRDVAIVGELRKLHPDLEVDWLAQHPVTTALEAAGERIHPASAWLANESAHIEHVAGEHDLHAFQAIREMDEILVSNFMVFAEVVEQEGYDLVVGDESWDVDYFLHENPGLKRFAFAWMTDFVGWLPMPDGGAREAALTADYNAEMIEQRARYARVRDRSIFVGNPDDVVPESFGPGLPMIREWVGANFDFAGYVTGFDQTDLADREALKSRLGYRADERLCVVTVGGSGVGEPLLRRVLDAVPLVRRELTDLRFLVVAGPRIDPRSLPRRRGVSTRGHVPNLYQHLAAADLAVVQGGLTTTMELTANQRPFIYVPLRHHFEQNFHVPYRLERYGAGRRLEYEQAVEPDVLAEAIVQEIAHEVSYRPVEADGAAVAGQMLAELL